MGEKKGDSEKGKYCNVNKELSDLVGKNVIPKKVASKLQEKIHERNINLTREQLHTLVNKVRELLTDSPSDFNNNHKVIENTDMQRLAQQVEKLQEKIVNLEKGNYRTQYPKDIYYSEEASVSEDEWIMRPLTDISNDPETIIVLMKWLQYLIDKCGRKHLTDILDYYVDIGWISEDVKINLLDYSQGITAEKTPEDVENIKGVYNLPAEGHIQSLMYIQKLKGVKLDRHFLDRIDAELTRITKKLDNYQLK